MAEKSKFDERISVSEIKLWAACPKQLYFNYSGWKRGREELWDEKSDLILKNDLLREICQDVPEMVLEAASGAKKRGEAIDEDELRKRLISKIEEIKNDMNLITEFKNRTDNHKKIQPAGKGPRQSMPHDFEEPEQRLRKNIMKTIERSGTELFEIAADPILTEKVLYFEKLNLYGAPPKVLEKNEKLTPYIIKITTPPTDGVWESEKLTAAAYIILLENTFGTENVSNFAVVDYFGDYRMIRVRPQDRKKVFRAVRKIRDIKTGKMPREKNIRLCEKCIYRQNCKIKARSLFSKLFGNDAD